MLKSIVAGAMSILVLAMPTHSLADGPAWKRFEGVYRPAITDGEQWSCDAADLGQDGGAVGVIGGALHGVENRCALTNPRLLSETSVEFTSVCEAEGDRITEKVILTKSSGGITLNRNGRTVEWLSCDQPDDSVDEIAAPDHDGSFGAWTSYTGMGWTEAATSDSRGSSLTFSCGEDRTLHYAGGVDVVLIGRAPASGPMRFDVDGQRYNLTQLTAGGVDLDCQGCEQTFRALWVAVSLGQRLVVTDHAGASATFSLSGSGAALGYDVCKVGETVE